MNLKRMKLLNTHVNNLTLMETLQYMSECIRTDKCIHLVSLNVDQVIKAEKDHNFHRIVEEAELVITDGTPLMWISRIFKRPIIEKIPGPHLAEKVLQYSAKKGYKVFLLGAQDGVGAKAAQLMIEKYKKLDICGVYSPPFGFENNKEELDKINTLLYNSDADILIVGLSAPKQEKFVYANKENYQIPVSLSLGAAIDFMAGNIERAPGFINKIGFEWLYRFFKEPKRLFRRYFIDDIKILKLIFKYKKKFE